MKPQPGQRLHYLTVLHESPTDGGYWFCRCECGTEKWIHWNSAVQGKIKSCGCFKRNQIIARCLKHGMTKSRTYRAWAAMLTRIRNRNRGRFKDYGGRGISVCARWLSFENFFADMGEQPQDKTIDRINNDGDYEPGNCRWATIKEQANNTRRSHPLTYRGETKPPKEWARIAGINYFTLMSRLSRGVAVDVALGFAPKPPLEKRR